MKSVYVTIMLFLSIPTYSQANDWQEYQNKVKMSLCSINHIAITSSPLQRDSGEEGYYCPVEDEWVNCFLSQSKRSNQKENEIRESIRDLYASRIMNRIGISTAKTRPDNSFSGTLEIIVMIDFRYTHNEKRSYSVRHKVNLYEEGLSRFGRKDNLRLYSWSDFYLGDDVTSLAQADMEAINLLSKVVEKMDETFKEAKEYCKKNNLFLH